MNSNKKVSCVLVTGHIPERRRLAEKAIECFNFQTWENKELIIINEGEPFNLPGEELVSPGMTLGELRNIGLKKATGDAVIQWDDDDWYHPYRIEYQVSFWSDKEAVILSNEIICNIKTKEAKVCSARRWVKGGFHGTILHNSRAYFRYPNKKKGEDTQFISQFKNVKALNNDPRLYIRFWHGDNTWDLKHFNGLSKLSRKLNAREELLLKDVTDWYKKDKNINLQKHFIESKKIKFL